MSDSETGGDSTKRGRGRPKKSLEPRSESKDSGTDEPKAKRGRGRPKGTANKKAKKTASSGSSGGSSNVAVEGPRKVMLKILRTHQTKEILVMIRTTKVWPNYGL